MAGDDSKKLCRFVSHDALRREYEGIKSDARRLRQEAEQLQKEYTDSIRRADALANEAMACLCLLGYAAVDARKEVATWHTYGG